MIVKSKKPNLVLFLNVTSTSSATEVRIKPKGKTWKVDPVSGQPLMAVAATEVAVTLSEVKPPLSKETIQKTASLAATSQGV